MQKNLLHDGILHSMFQAGLLSKLVFQGGTALQRIYRNPRLSEDLDFNLLEARFPSESFTEHVRNLEKTVRQCLVNVYQIPNENIIFKHPGNMDKELDEPSSVKSIWINVVLDYGKPRQTVKIDIEQVPALTSEFHVFEALPSSLPIHPFSLNVKSLNEIVLDKVVALIQRSRILSRDLFDFHYLSKNMKLDLDDTLMEKKILAKGLLNVSHILDVLDVLDERINLLSSPDPQFIAESNNGLERFFPASTCKSFKESGIVSTFMTSAAKGLQRFRDRIAAMR
jgi:predicted nucleotidyltransferase component of viral defense system